MRLLVKNFCFNFVLNVVPGSSTITNNTTAGDMLLEQNESQWSEQETLALIAAYECHQEDLRNARKRKYVWQIISEELASNGVLVSK